MKSICIILTTRGNYAKMKSFMYCINESSDLELKLVVGGLLLTDDYAHVLKQIKDDGFKIDGYIDYIGDDSSYEAIALSAAKCTSLTAKLLLRLAPDYLMLIADRFEVLAIAQAALCLNIKLVHLEGGERSGSVDERIRHALTKLSHIHFVSNKDAAQRVIRLGEQEDTVFIVGSPSFDLVTMDSYAKSDLSQINSVGYGHQIDFNQPYLVISYHPVITVNTDLIGSITLLIDVLSELDIQAVWIQPNHEVGHLDVNATIRNKIQNLKVRVVSALQPTLYLKLLDNCMCLVGNSSSGLRESAFLGVPVVNIGGRQQNRLISSNVKTACYVKDDILQKISLQKNTSRYEPCYLYGDGRSGMQMLDAIRKANVVIDKEITF